MERPLPSSISEDNILVRILKVPESDFLKRKTSEATKISGLTKLTLFNPFMLGCISFIPPGVKKPLNFQD